MPPRTKSSTLKIPFDLGGCDHCDLPTFLVDGALAQGWPATKTIFKLQMLSTEWHEAVTIAVNKLIDQYNNALEEWKTFAEERRRAWALEPWLNHSNSTPAQRSTRDAERGADRVAISLRLDRLSLILKPLLGIVRARKLTLWLDDRVKETRRNFNFVFTYTFLAAMVLERCMGCAGQGRQCEHVWLATTTGVASKNFPVQWPCGQAHTTLYVAPKCLDKLTLKLDWGGSDPFRNAKKLAGHTEPERQALWNVAVAKAMLRKVQIFDTDSSTDSLFYGDTSVYAGDRTVVFLEKNFYVNPNRTLQGRLGIDSMEVIKLDARATLESKNMEVRMRREVRISRFESDINNYLRDNICMSYKDMQELYPSFVDSLKRLITLGDPVQISPSSYLPEALRSATETEELQLFNPLSQDENPTRRGGSASQSARNFMLVHEPRAGAGAINAMEIPRVRNFTQRLIFAHSYMRLLYENIYGVPPSGAALEWALDLYTGAVPGPPHSDRRLMDNPDPSPLKPFPQGRWLEIGKADRYLSRYNVSVWDLTGLFLFDAIGNDDWDFSIQLVSDLEEDAPGRRTMPTQNFPRWGFKLHEIVWVLKNEKRGIAFYDHVRANTKKVFPIKHAELLAAFAKAQPTSELELPRVVPPGIFKHSSLKPTVNEDHLHYLQEMSVLMHFKATRAIFMNYLGMTSYGLRCTVKNHQALWMGGHIKPGGSFAPNNDNEYLNWLMGKKFEIYGNDDDWSLVLQAHPGDAGSSAAHSLLCAADVDPTSSEAGSPIKEVEGIDSSSEEDDIVESMEDNDDA